MADLDLMNSQDPMQQQQMVGTPPPFMQSGISPMMTGAPPQAGGVLPPSNPVDAAQGAQPNIQSAMGQLAQTAAGGPGQVGGLYGREQAAMGPQMGGALPGMMQQRQELSGQQSFHPNFQHGGGAGGFFHNLGQALLALGAATAPGQAIDAVTHSRQREEYAGLSDQIKSLQEQQKITQEPEPGLAAVPYHAAMVGINQQKADTQQQRADTYAQRVTDQATNEFGRLAQGAQRLDKTQQKIEIDKWYKSKMLPIMEERIKAGERNTDVKADALKSLGAAAQSNKLPIEHPFIMGAMDLINEWTGTDMKPGLQAPAGAETVDMKPGKAPSRPEASKAAGAPKVGEVRRGFRFKGGNPASQASWEKVGQ